MGRYRSKRKSRTHRPVSVHKQIKKKVRPHTDDMRVLKKWDLSKSLKEVFHYFINQTLIKK